MKKMLLHCALVLCCLLSFNKAVFAQADLYIDSLNVYVDDYGSLGLYTLTPTDTIKQLARMTPLVGTADTSVFDYKNDMDIEDPTQFISNPKLSDYEIYGSFNNNYSGLAPNVLVKETFYCWKHQFSVVAKYTVINRETTPINEIFGLECIPEINHESLGTDTVTYSSQTKIFSDRKDKSVGFKFLSGNLNSLNVSIWYSHYWDGDTNLYKMLAYGKIDSLFIIDPSNPNVDDPVLVPSFKTKTIAPGDSAIYYMAISYGYNKDVMAANMALADQKYSQITSIKSGSNGIPTNYSLNQNYPNPFNPSTKISYSIPKSGHVTLKVYNSIGKEVATLVNAERTAGRYDVDFKAQGLTSGVYFYSIQAGQFHQTQKMILLK